MSEKQKEKETIFTKLVKRFDGISAKSKEENVGNKNQGKKENQEPKEQTSILKDEVIEKINDISTEVKICENTADEKMENVIDSIVKLKNSEWIRNADLFEKEFENIIERLNEKSFRLAVVGEFSAGKSTFLNVLLGKDILLHGAQETTATITEIENDNTCQNQFLFDVVYQNGSSEKNIPIAELADYTATSSKKYQVASEIYKVIIRAPILGKEYPVTLIDTPGLNGIADMHREKTIDQIKNAHACIYIMQVRGLGSSDIDFIKYISNYQKNIIFVQNFIDELKNLEGESAEEKVKQQRKIIEEKIKVEHPDLIYQIVAVSSRKALISKCKEFKDYEGIELNVELRKKLYTESKFEEVYAAILKLADNNEKSNLQKKDSVKVALGLIQQIEQIVDIQLKQTSEEWEKSSEGIKQKKCQEIIAELDKQRESDKLKLDNYIKSSSAEIRRRVRNKIDSGIQSIEKRHEDNVKGMLTKVELEQYSGKLSDYFKMNIIDLETEENNFLNSQFENVLQNAIMRILEYTGRRVKSVSQDDIKFESEHLINKITVDELKKENSEIEELDKEWKNVNTKYKKTKNQIEKGKYDLKNANEQLENSESNARRNYAQHQKEINKLGVMPEKIKKQRTEIVSEYRGGFGILDNIFGPREVEKTVDYWDDGEQRAWKNRKNNLENEFRKKEYDIKRKIEMYSSKIDDITKELRRNEKLEIQYKNEIEILSQSINIAKKELEVKQEKAKEEYLVQLKGSMIRAIQDYLKNVNEKMNDTLDAEVKYNEEKIMDYAEKKYTILLNQRIKTLESMLNKNSGKKITEDIHDFQLYLNETKEILRRYVG